MYQQQFNQVVPIRTYITGLNQNLQIGNVYDINKLETNANSHISSQHYDQRQQTEYFTSNFMQNQAQQLTQSNYPKLSQQPPQICSECTFNQNQIFQSQSFQNHSQQVYQPQISYQCIIDYQHQQNHELSEISKSLNNIESLIDPSLQEQQIPKIQRNEHESVNYIKSLLNNIKNIENNKQVELNLIEQQLDTLISAKKQKYTQ